MVISGAGSGQCGREMKLIWIFFVYLLKGDYFFDGTGIEMVRNNSLECGCRRCGNVERK